MSKANGSVQTRRDFLKAMGFGAAALAGPRVLSLAGAAEAKAARPNVIVVITDDQGYGDLGCHGNKVIRTPNLDRLHGQSTRLTDFHVGPTCSPTRAALMSGRYCNRTGVWHTIMGRSMLRKDEVTLANVFADGGYRTGHFGKWHLGDNYPFSPRYRGFEVVWRHGGGGVGQTPDYWGNDYTDDTYEHNGKFVKHTGYCTDVWFEGAMKFIDESVKRSKPFFCYLTTNAPHGPFNVPAKYSEMYQGKPDVPSANFYGMITNIDENMGRLMKRLDDLGIAEGTILIFMTDNGTAGGFRGGKGFNAGMRGTKGSEYDGGHRVPCFIRWPGGGIEAGVDIGRITAHIDLMPTLAALCGIARPKGVKLDGDSLAPLLRANDANWPDRVLITDSQRLEDPVKWRKSAVMTDRWRLVNGKELYDMKADPGQKTSVAEANPKVVEQLRAEYEKWWASVSERFAGYCETIIGSERENPVRLTAHDWHGGGANRTWNQGHIRGGPLANGFWAVDVARAGTYELELRRWPKEADKPIRERLFDVTEARLRIANVDQTQPVAADAKTATFRVKIEAGKTKLETWFLNGKGKSCGAFYVYAKYVGP
ncbi:MAG: arylsulfatase [Phycisphaerae bacterium]